MPRQTPVKKRVEAAVAIVVVTVLQAIVDKSGIISEPSSKWGTLVWLIGIAGLVLAWLWCKAEAPAPMYFKAIDFGNPYWDRFLRLTSPESDHALGRLLNGDKAEPAFVHVACEFPTVQLAIDELKDSNTVLFFDRPGTGKSMAAYQIAHRLSQGNRKQRWRPYRLEIPSERPPTREELTRDFDRIANQRPLVVVDDAQNLDADTRKWLYKELANAKVIWLETDREEGGGGQNFGRIQFDGIKETLLAFAKLHKRWLPGLAKAEDALARKRVKDTWHFLFIASEGEKRISDAIEALDAFDRTVLYWIAAYLVLTGEADLSLRQVVEAIEPGNDALYGKSVTAKTVSKLAEHREGAMPLLRRRKDEKIDGLHFLAERMVMRKILELSSGELVADLLARTSRLLRTPGKLYPNLLLRMLNERGEAFVTAHRAWFRGYLASVTSETVVECVSLLTVLHGYHFRWEPDANELDKIAQRMGGAWVNSWPMWATFCRALHKDGVALLRYLWPEDVENLARRLPSVTCRRTEHIRFIPRHQGRRPLSPAERTDGEALQNAATMLELMKDLNRLRRDAMLAHLSDDQWRSLAERMAEKPDDGRGDIPVGRLGSMAAFVTAIGSKAPTLLRHINDEGWQRLADAASEASVRALGEVGNLLHVLEPDRQRPGFVNRLNVGRLAHEMAKAAVEDFDQVAAFITASRDRWDAGNPIIEAIAPEGWKDMGRTASDAPAGRFGRVALLLNSLDADRERPKLLKHLDFSALLDRARSAKVTDLEGLTCLMADIGAANQAPFQAKLPWLEYIRACPVDPMYLQVLGCCLANIRANAETIGEAVPTETLQWIRDHEMELQVAVNLGLTCSSRRYQRVAAALRELGTLDQGIATRIARETLEEAARSVIAHRDLLRYLGKYIRALRGIDPALAKKFVTHMHVQDKLVKILSKGGWEWAPEGARVLVWAVVESDRSAWDSILRRLPQSVRPPHCDRARLELDEIYASVAKANAEAKARAAAVAGGA